MNKNRANFSKQVFSLMLAAVIAIGLFTFSPMTVSAASSGSTIDVNDSSTASGDGWTYAGGVFTVTGNVTIGSSAGVTTPVSNRIVVPSGADVEIVLGSNLGGVNIQSSDCAFEIQAGAKVNLKLFHFNTLVSNGTGRAGLEVAGGAELVIADLNSGGGTLNATGGTGSAGIGGGNGSDCGKITINSGYIVAASGGFIPTGAGIGGRASGSGGEIIINGGIVKATGKSTGAGIGGGVGGSGGKITINGGDVTATSVYGAGIGGGNNGGGGEITITGGIVNAKGGKDVDCNANDIGAGDGGNAGTTQITGGSVFAANGLINGFGAPIYPVKVTVTDSGTEADGITVTCGSYIAKTGGNLTDAFASGTLDQGVAWLWLPAGEVYIEANDGTTKEGFANPTVATSGDNATSITLDTSSPTNTATLNVNKDDTPWNDHGKSFALKLSGNESKTAVMTGTGGTMTASVRNGTWKVYDGTIDTGATITVSDAAGDATLDYYTISFAVTNAQTASGSIIGATYDGGSIDSGDAVLGGKTLVITATGAGSTGYTYVWSGEGTNGETGNAITITALSAPVSAVCTVTGIIPTYDLTVTNGTGSGNYETGTKVSIKANAAPAGNVFDKWTSTGGGSFADANSASTTFTMPANAATVAATYKQLPEPTKDQLTYSLTAKTYNGKAQGATVKPKSGVGKVTAIYYNNSKTVPTNAGSYAIKVDVAAGTQYSAASNIKLGTFTINKADLSKVKVTIADTAWTGKQIKPKKFTYNGVSFSISTNATVKKYGANKNIGKGTIKLTGKGNFKGTKTITFKIVPKKNSVSKITAGKKQMKVTWKKVSAAQRIIKYEVRYRAKGTSKWTTKAYAASKSSATIKSLKKGKTYEVQVRSYKTVSGVKYYSAWSAAKTSGKIK